MRAGWVVYDMTAKDDGPHFGPCSEAAADALVSRNPDVYRKYQLGPESHA